MGRVGFSPEQIIGRLRDEHLKGEVLDALAEAKVLVEGWRREYNHFRSHSSLGIGRRLQRHI